MTNNQTPDDKLLSAGTPSDSAGIQFLETLSIGGLGVAVGASFLGAGWIVAIAAVVAGGSTALALRSRWKRIHANETEVRHARYTFLGERDETIKLSALPDDVKSAIKNLVTETSLSRFEVAARLRVRIGETRANQYLPMVLQQGDRTLVTNKPPTENA